MRFLVSVTLAVSVYGIALQESPKLLEIERHQGQVVPGHYIVTLKPEADAAAVESHLSWVSDVHKRSLGKRNTAGVEQTYGINEWKGYAGEFDDETIAEIKSNPEVRTLH